MGIQDLYFGGWLGSLFEPKAMKDLREQTKIAKQQTRERQALTEQGRINALQQQLGLMGPYNDFLTKIYGPEYAIPLEGLIQNPMPKAEATPVSFNERQQGSGWRNAQMQAALNRLYSTKPGRQ
jgi:hypothetical protein